MGSPGVLSGERITGDDRFDPDAATSPDRYYGAIGLGGTGAGFQTDSDPVAGGRILVSQHMQALAHGVGAVFNHGKVHAAVGIQIVTDHSPAIEFLRHSEQPGHVFEAGSRLIEEQNIVLKSVP